MRIQHNIMAMSAYRNYTNNVNAMKKNLEKLSSGYKINRAGDDAAGLAISEKMRAQITGLETAQKNAKDGISLVQTAEGALTEVHDMLNRMVELATQSANGTYDNTTDRAQMQKEVDQLLSEIDRIADSSNFNGIKLLDGSLGLNTDAFKITAGDTYQAAVNPAPVNVTTSDYHGGEAVAGQAPTLTIDVNDVAIKNTAASSAAVKFKFTFAGTEYNATTASIAAGASASGSAIANAIQDALDTAFTSNASASGHKLVDIGGLAFKGSVAGGKIAFTFYATKGTAAASQTWDDVVTGAAGKTVADNWNKDHLGNEFKIAAGTAGELKDGMTEIHAHTTVANAVADQPAARPGISIDLAGLVQNGYKLTIASGTGTTASKTTYVFKTDKDSNVTAGAGETLIDVSNVATADQAKHAAWIIAGGSVQNAAGTAPDGANAGGTAQTAAGGVFKVGYKGGTKLHIDVAASSKAAVGNTEDKMKKLITAQDAGSAEKIASTKLYVTGKAKEGNVLNIGDDKITFNGGEDIDAIMTAIQGKGYTVTKATDADGAYLNIEGKATGKDEDGNTITIAAEDRTAPQILGKGLTLQIGDTSDTFNQLNVSVQDMHSGSIGIGKLDISTEEAAQAATDKIKAAINVVSDVRGTLGATQNRLDHTINNLSVMTENIQDAESTIRDTDVAAEMMAYTKNNILIQSAQAMLAQANQVPQGVLQLLQ